MHYTYSTGPVSSTRTVHTTHTSTSGGSILGGGTYGGTSFTGIGGGSLLGGGLLGGTMMPGTTRVVQTSQPIVTQTRYVNTGPTMVYQGGPMMVSPGLTRLGSISLRPISNYTSHPVTMGLAAPMMQVPQTAKANQQATYSNSASLNINGLLCEGYIAIQNDQIVQAKNLFIGVAPFYLGTDSLEVTPDLTVVTRNPDIVYHLADLPNETVQSLTLTELRNIAQIPTDKTMYIGLPGQQASLVTTGADGSIQVQQQDPRMGKLVGASLF